MAQGGGRVYSNLWWMFAARGANGLAVMGSVALISRAYGSHYFGVYSFFYAVIITATLVSDFGLDVYLVREIASSGGTEQPARETVSRKIADALGAKILISLAVTSVIALVTLAGAGLNLTTEETFLFLMCMPIVVAGSAAHTLWFAGDGLRRNSFHGGLWAMTNFLRFMAVAVAWYAGWDFAAMIYMLVAAEIAGLLISGAVVGKYIAPVRASFSPAGALRLFTESYRLGLGLMLSVLYFRLDQIMLEVMTGPVITGWYGAAARIIEFVTVIPGTLAIVFFPMMVSRLASMDTAQDAEPAPGETPQRESGRAELIKRIKTGAWVIGSAGLIVSAGLYLLAGPLISTLFGAGFNESVAVLEVICWSVGLLFINYAGSYLLIAAGRENLNNGMNVLAIIANFIGNLVLIPEYRHLGSAVATVGSELFLSAMMGGYFLFYGSKLFTGKFAGGSKRSDADEE